MSKFNFIKEPAFNLHLEALRAAFPTSPPPPQVQSTSPVVNSALGRATDKPEIY